MIIKYDMPYEQDALDQITKYNKEYRKQQPNNYVVEIGCSNNSWLLNEPLKNLSGIRIDADLYKILSYGPSVFPVKSINKKVSADNICKILEENNVPKDFFMLFIDIDGPDFSVMLSILKKYNPKIIVTEYNEIIPYPVKFAVRATSSNFTWSGGPIYGYSIKAAEDLMIAFNYNLDKVIVNNLFLVRNDSTESPNIKEVKKLYESGYVHSKKYPRTDKTLFSNEYNLPLHFLQELKTKEEVAAGFKKWLLDNPINRYDTRDITINLHKCLFSEEYEKYLKEFLEK